MTGGLLQPLSTTEGMPGHVGNTTLQAQGQGEKQYTLANTLIHAHCHSYSQSGFKGIHELAIRF